MGVDIRIRTGTAIHPFFHIPHDTVMMHPCVIHPCVIHPQGLAAAVDAKRDKIMFFAGTMGGAGVIPQVRGSRCIDAP